MIKLTVNEVPPSNNKYMGNSNSYHIYRNDKKLWQQIIGYSANGKIPKKPFKKAEVTITYYFPTKHRRDPDNYSGKLILDPLVRCGILEDDSFSNIVNLNLNGKYDKDNPRTEIIVKEVS